MKIKIISIAFAMLCMAVFLHAQPLQYFGDTKLEFAGEIKAGLFWERVEWTVIDRHGDLRAEAEERFKFHHNDDAGEHGRFRLDMNLFNNNMGMKVRFQQTNFSEFADNSFDFAFAYGDFLNEQLRLEIGKLEGSPYSAGGPDIWQNLDRFGSSAMGIRTEIKPNFVKGLSIGFLLNGWNQANYFPEKNHLVDLLSETVVGASYTHDYFHARLSYRFDGESDVYNHDWFDGTDMMYRLEERILRELLSDHDIRLWINGWWRGIGSEDMDIVNYQNWLYADWYTGQYITQLRFGYHTGVQRNEIQTRLTFGYKIPIGTIELVPSIAGLFRLDFGESVTKDVPYKLFFIEPHLRINLNSRAHVIFVYHFEHEPLCPETFKRTQWANMRVQYSF